LLNDENTELFVYSAVDGQTQPGFGIPVCPSDFFKCEFTAVSFGDLTAENQANTEPPCFGRKERHE